MSARFDTIIRGGTVATEADTFACDIGIRGEKIVALGDDLGDAAEIVDATGRLVLPGGIDSHVHVAQPSAPGIVMADDFESGTRAAAFGGNTMILPFALQERGQSLRQVVKDYHAKADGRCFVDVSFHLIISDASEMVLGQELPALVHDGYTSFKVFMTYEGLALSDLEMLNVMAVARETGALVMVHAENYDAIRFLTDRLERAGKTAPHFHATSRPIPVEREATHRAISLAEIVDVPVMIVHVSSRRGDGGNPPRPAEGAQGLRRDLPAISGAHRQGPRRPQHGGREIRLLAAAARCREPAGVLGRPAAEGVLAVLLGPLPVPLRRSPRQARAQGQERASAGCRTAFPASRRGCRSCSPKASRPGGSASTSSSRSPRPTMPRPTASIRARARSRSAAMPIIAIWDTERRTTITQALMHHGTDYTPYEGLRGHGLAGEHHGARPLRGARRGVGGGEERTLCEPPEIAARGAARAWRGLTSRKKANSPQPGLAAASC